MILRPDHGNISYPKTRQRLQAAKMEEVKKRQAAPEKKPKKRSRKSKVRGSLPLSAPAMSAELKQVNINAAGIDVGAPRILSASRKDGILSPCGPSAHSPRTWRRSPTGWQSAA